MRCTLERRPAAVTVVLAMSVAVAAVAGGGYARAQAAVIHACANNHTGALRVAPRCGANEHALIWNNPGPMGLRGLPGPPGPSTGPAGGALAGAYPNPTLKVSGGPCANGQALTNISTVAKLTCGPGVYSDASGNVVAGPSPFGALTIGNANTALGASMLASDTSGSANVAMGSEALHDDTTGSSNSAVGVTALADNAAGGDDVADGFWALHANTAGDYNSAVGAYALSDNTASGNVADGYQALAGNTTGQHNTSVGEDSGGVIDGSNNTAVGWLAGGSRTGNDNTSLGWFAGSVLNGSESSDINIGSDGMAGESNTIRIGGDNDGTAPGEQKALIIPAAESNLGAAAELEIDPITGQIGVETSSRRFKTDIRRISAHELNGMMALQPVAFRYKRQYIRGSNLLDYGLIAEQVAKVLPNLVVYARGKPYSVLYQELPALLLGEIQRQQRQISQLESDNGRLAKLQAEVQTLMHQASRR